MFSGRERSRVYHHLCCTHDGTWLPIFAEQSKCHAHTLQSWDGRSDQPGLLADDKCTVYVTRPSSSVLGQTSRRVKYLDRLERRRGAKGKHAWRSRSSPGRSFPLHQCYYHSPHIKSVQIAGTRWLAPSRFSITGHRTEVTNIISRQRRLPRSWK
jgi:hypothetical protein